MLQVAVNGEGIPHEMKCLDIKVDLSEAFKGWMECAETQLSEEDVKAFKDPNTPADKKKEIGMTAHKNMVRITYTINFKHCTLEY